MDFLKKYSNDYEAVYNYYMLVYNLEMEYLDDIIKFTSLKNRKKSQIEEEIIDILTDAIISERIFIYDSFKKKNYSKDAVNELFEIVIPNIKNFLNLENTQYPYRFEVHYTKEWKKELAKIGLWDREILKE